MSSVYTPVSTFHTSVTIPSDGDQRNAASVNVTLEGIADNAQWCHDRIGTNRLVGLLNSGVNEASNSETFTQTSGSNTIAVTSNALIIGLGSFATVVINDIAELTVSGTVALLNASAPPQAWMRVFYQQGAGGYAAVANAAIGFQNIIQNETTYWPFSITAYTAISSSTGAAAFALYGRVNIVTNTILTLVGSLNCVARLWRGN
jgi:hypothetical protein